MMDHNDFLGDHSQEDDENYASEMEAAGYVKVKMFALHHCTVCGTAAFVPAETELAKFARAVDEDGDEYDLTDPDNAIIALDMMHEYQDGLDEAEQILLWQFELHMQERHGAVV